MSSQLTVLEYGEVKSAVNQGPAAGFGRGRQAVVGRSIPRVLLAHALALNVDWLGPLLSALEYKGSDRVSPEGALEDPACERPVDGWTATGEITWLHRWAITDGADRSTFAGEPEPSEWLAAIGP